MAELKNTIYRPDTENEIDDLHQLKLQIANLVFEASTDRRTITDTCNTIYNELDEYLNKYKNNK